MPWVMMSSLRERRPKKNGKKGFFGGWWKPAWFRHNRPTAAGLPIPFHLQVTWICSFDLLWCFGRRWFSTIAFSVKMMRACLTHGRHQTPRYHCDDGCTTLAQVALSVSRSMYGSMSCPDKNGWQHKTWDLYRARATALLTNRHRSLHW